MQTGVRASHLWLPFTQMQGFDASQRTFVRGEGTSLVDSNGRRFFDATSSIWTIVHGHCRPRIAEAIAIQARELDHSTLLGATHPRAEELAERLCALTQMDRVFFASDGASAIEAALKMALQYWQNVGEPQRVRFVRLTGAYHGDTAGAMSVSDIGVFKSRFGAVTFDSVPYERAGSLDTGDVAAIVIEPLVQAAAGMQLVPPERYAALRDIDALLIVDEIATGFGRTGGMFAFDSLGLRPDLLCVGKSITGGALALSATLATSRVFDAFSGHPQDAAHFFHGHSYAGNPIACAAAIASLEMFDEESTLANAATIGQRMEARLALLSAHPLVRATRRVGTMAGIELAIPGRAVANGLYERGHFTRAIGDVLQLVPPLASAPHEIDGFFDALESELA